MSITSIICSHLDEKAFKRLWLEILTMSRFEAYPFDHHMAAKHLLDRWKRTDHHHFLSKLPANAMQHLIRMLCNGVQRCLLNYQSALSRI
jgi:hypothetical protein